MIPDLTTVIIRDGKVPTDDWEQNFIVCLYKGKLCSGQRQLLRPQADQAGHKDPRDDCRWSLKTGGVY